MDKRRGQRSAAISKIASCEPSGRTNTSAERKRTPGISGAEKARLSPYLHSEALEGLKPIKGVPNSGRSLTKQSPFGASLIKPVTEAVTPAPDTNIAWTFVDSVIHLCRRSLASCAVMSAPVPSEEMFLLLVGASGIREAKYWADKMGFPHAHCYRLLSQLAEGSHLET